MFCCVGGRYGGYDRNPPWSEFHENISLAIILSFFLSFFLHNGTNTLYKPQPWVIQAVVAPSWNSANHKAKKDTLNWPCTPQNSLNLSPKSSLKWKISGNEDKSPMSPFYYPHNAPPTPPPCPPILGCFLWSQHKHMHTHSWTLWQHNCTKHFWPLLCIHTALTLLCVFSHRV